MRFEPDRLLPHEILFGVFLCVMWLRLALAGAAASIDGIVFLALIGVNLCLILAAQKRQSRAAWMARLVYYPVAINIVFQQLRTAIPAVHPGKADLALQ